MNDLLTQLQDTTVAGIPLPNLLTACAVALLAYVVMTTAFRLALARLSKVAARSANQVDDTLLEVLGQTSRWLLALVAVLIGVGMLDLSDRWADRVSQLWFVVLVVQMALWANRFITIGLRRYAQKEAGTPTAPVSAAGTLMSWGARTLLWSIVLLAMLSNLGVNITAFVASLGVGGIAIALAAQTVLADLFASVAIATDKPFEVGDFIVLGSVAGTVEVVGIKTTRVRSLGGEQVVFSNTELLKQTISNYKRLHERRIVFTFGVTYETTPEQAAGIPEVVKRIVQGSERLRFDRAHFKGFGESSLDYEVVYIVLDPDYNLYMDEQQRINLALMRELAAMKVGFAFPSRTVYVAALPVAPAAEVPQAARKRILTEAVPAG